MISHELSDLHEIARIFMDAGNPRCGGSSTSVVEDHEESRTDGLIPWLFTSIPSFNEAASYITETTSYITSCFSESSGSYSPLDHSNNARELVTFPFKQSLDTLDDAKPSSVASHSEFSEAISTATAAPALHGGLIRRPTFVSSSNARLPEKEPHSNQSGVTMFQSLIERARRTIRGSAEDIGWLKHATAMPPVEDGTQRFFEILDRIRHGVHELPNSLVYLLVPGLFSNHGPLYFVNTKISFSKMGLTCHIAKIHSEASVEKNAREIKEYIEEIYWGSNKRVLLLGHSKGGVDAAAALSMYWSELKDKVAGLAFAQSPYGGSPIASDLMREGQLGDYVNFRKLMEILVCKVIKGDLQALEDLTYEKRKEFLRKHQLPRELPIVSFRTEAGVTPAVLDALNHVAHAELPVVTGTPTKLPVVMPLGAVMAACAQLLQLRYREKSDGLVTCCDAEVPGSVVVRPERKLDHAWMVYSTLNNDPLEADASQVCEALLLLVVEVGQKKRLENALKDD